MSRSLGDNLDHTVGVIPDPGMIIIIIIVNL